MSLPRDLKELQSAQAAGESLDYLFFPDCGSFNDPPTTSALSQWATTPFVLDNLEFHSAEQAMMHGKAILFDDEEIADRILKCRTPFTAKNLGAQVRGFSEPTWKSRRFEIVVAANFPKFFQIPSLRELLISTGKSILVEASATDLVWGNGLDAFDPAASDPSRWPGLNLLGFALMEVRAMVMDRAEHRA